MMSEVKFPLVVIRKTIWESNFRVFFKAKTVWESKAAEGEVTLKYKTWVEERVVSIDFNRSNIVDIIQRVIWMMSLSNWENQLYLCTLSHSLQKKVKIFCMLCLFIESIEDLCCCKMTLVLNSNRLNSILATGLTSCVSLNIRTLSWIFMRLELC